MHKSKCVYMDPCVLQQQGKNTEIPRDVTGRERERVNAYTKRATPLNISLRLIFRGIANHQKKQPISHHFHRLSLT